MSAPQIPNLLSLRDSRGGFRGASGRGRNRGGRQGYLASGASSLAHDATVQNTDTDAAISRLSAVHLGYLDDPYAKYFVQSIDGTPIRRLPIINRGTYTRTAALDTIVSSFLSGADDVECGAGREAGQARTPKQIVSLGAGTDTRPFRLFAKPGHQELIYHEIDFEVISRKKLQIVRGNPQLSSILTELSISEPNPEPRTDLGNTQSYSWSSRPSQGGEYYCHGLDLRRFSDSQQQTELEPSKTSSLLSGLRTDVPTLIISECCLCYLSPAHASAVLEFFTSRIPSLATVIYEPIRPNDAFGQVMVSNLAARRIQMPTLYAYPEPKDQEARLEKAGFDTARQMTIGEIWKTWITPREKERLDSFEVLDEVEEWELLAAHYIIAWASRGHGFDLWNDDLRCL